MNDAARDGIRLALFAGCYVLVFGIGAIVSRVKRDSSRWQRRSKVEQRLLSRLPGILIAVAVYVAVILFTPFWS